KLKKINQLTSENTQNTTMVISAITSFVNSVDSFKLSVINEYEERKSTFDNISESLKSSFKRIDENTFEQSKKLTKLLNDTSVVTTNEIVDLKEKIKETIQKYISSLEEVNSNIQNSILLFTKTTAESIGEREA